MYVFGYILVYDNDKCEKSRMYNHNIAKYVVPCCVLYVSAYL